MLPTRILPSETAVPPSRRVRRRARMAGLAIAASLVGSVAVVGGVGTAGAATTPAAGRAAPQVTVTDLGAPDRLAVPLFPEDLNNQGVVTGYGVLGGPQPFQAFTWSQGALTPLPAPTADPGAFSFPVAINNQGQVAGFTTVGGTLHSLRWSAGTPTDISAPGGNSHPLDINDPGQVLLQEGGAPALWDNGTRTAVAPFPATFAVGLNDAGQVFGTGHGPDGQDRAFVWTPTGTVDVGSFGLTTTAVDLNDGGQLVGNGALTNSPNYTHGFLWTPARNGRAAALTDIGTLAGRETEVRDISDAGQVVGRSGTSTGWHAVSWKNGRLTDLGVLRGGSSSEAIAVNESGQVAGWASASDGRAHATLWKNGRLIDLGIPSGFTQSYAIDINDSGLVLGYAIQDVTGAVHSLVWTVTGG